MDAVYLCRHGDNDELRMSLRSLTNMPFIDRVWIFGGKPQWVTNIEYVNIPEQGNKHRHTNITMRAACEHPDVTDPFVYMNDDMYVTQPIEHVPVLNGGTIREVIDTRLTQGTNTRHTEGMNRTLDYLEANGHPDPLSFELHVPMLIHKEPMLDALNTGPYQRRTIYGALTGLTGTTTQDVKITRPYQPLPKGPFLSTSDETFPWAETRLQRLFPNTSQYEHGHT